MGISRPILEAADLYNIYADSKYHQSSPDKIKLRQRYVTQFT